MYDKPLSYSGLSLYKRCPRAWKHAYVDGNRTPPAKAAMRGTKLHEALENYFNGGLWPESNDVLRPWKGFMYDLATLFPEPEKKIAVDHHWEPVEFEDPAALFRGAIDLTYVENDTLHIIDFKSGKKYASHVDQGLAYLALSPEYKTVSVEFIYLDLPKEVEVWNYTIEDRTSQIIQLKEIIEEVRNDEAYTATPTSDGCRYCELSWRKNGPCQSAP